MPTCLAYGNYKLKGWAYISYKEEIVSQWSGAILVVSVESHWWGGNECLEIFEVLKWSYQINWDVGSKGKRTVGVTK